jgi:SAM-dependent methyltransferase
MATLESFADFLDLLQDDLEFFRYPVLDLVDRYGESYKGNALFILGRLEKFAGAQGDTLVDTLSFYARYVKQVAEDRQRLQGGTKAGAIPWDRQFQLEYIYALTLSTALNRSRYELFVDYRRVLEEHFQRGALLEIGAGNCLDAEFASSCGTVRAYEKNELSRVWQSALSLDKTFDLRIEEYRFDEPDAYDFVTMIELLEHLEDPGKCLENTARVLKDGGLAYLTFAIRMPQIDHLFNFMSVQECRNLLAETSLAPIWEQCLIDTYLPFEENERWRLADDPRQAVIYCCLVRKMRREELGTVVDEFNERLE